VYKRQHILFLNDFISSDEIHSLISVADVIVFPYTEDRIIGASGTLASCALYNKAIIASDIPRFSQEIVDMVDGLLVKPNDVKELGISIILLLNDDTLRREIGEKLANKSRSKTWKHVARRTFDLYTNMSKKQADK